MSHACIPERWAEIGGLNEVMCSEKQQLPVFHEHSLSNEGMSNLTLFMFAYSTCTGFLSTCISQMVVSSSIDNLGPRNSTIDLSFSVYCDWCRLPTEQRKWEGRGFTLYLCSNSWVLATDNSIDRYTLIDNSRLQTNKMVAVYCWLYHDRYIVLDSLSPS